MHILVLGSGVSGLSCAIRLGEAGHAVTVWARELPPRTTSNVAAAIWYPYRAYPEDRVIAWAGRTFAVLAELAAVPGSGVSLVEGIELWARPGPDPSWSGAVSGFRQADAAELWAGRGGGCVFTVPLAEMPRYLDYLVERLLALGGRIVPREVGTLAEALAESRVVVNATGLGARALAGDPSVVPIRGQLVRVAGRPTDRFIIDDDNPDGITYIIPRGADCILGGTAEEGEGSLAPDPAGAAAIRARAAVLVPALRDASVLEERVGLRPGRPSVRVEAEPLPDGRLVVHNYGHGGSGVTLSWGCAEEVAALVERSLAAPS